MIQKNFTKAVKKHYGIGEGKIKTIIYSCGLNIRIKPTCIKKIHYDKIKTIICYNIKYDFKR